MVFMLWLEYIFKCFNIWSIEVFFETSWYFGGRRWNCWMMMSSNGFVSITDRIFPDDVALKRTDSPATTLSNGDDDGGSEPVIPPDSPISCVSSRLQVRSRADWYDNVLIASVFLQHFHNGSGFLSYLCIDTVVRPRCHVKITTKSSNKCSDAESY